MAQECPHIEEVNFSNVLSELQALFNGELSHKQLFTGPEIQEAKENWVCIDVLSTE